MVLKYKTRKRSLQLGACVADGVRKEGINNGQLYSTLRLTFTGYCERFIDKQLVEILDYGAATGQ
jgi:hypothetical protein